VGGYVPLSPLRLSESDRSRRGHQRKGQFFFFEFAPYYSSTLVELSYFTQSFNWSKNLINHKRDPAISRNSFYMFLHLKYSLKIHFERQVKLRRLPSPLLTFRARSAADFFEGNQRLPFNCPPQFGPEYGKVYLLAGIRGQLLH
jgi:hypothetical protein